MVNNSVILHKNLHLIQYVFSITIFVEPKGSLRDGQSLIYKFPSKTFNPCRVFSVKNIVLLVVCVELHRVRCHQPSVLVMRRCLSNRSTSSRAQEMSSSATMQWRFVKLAPALVTSSVLARCDVVIRAALRWQDRERRLVELCFLVFVLLKSLLCLFLFMFLHSYSMSLEMNHCLFWQILPNSFCELLYSDIFCDLRFFKEWVLCFMTSKHN